MLPMEDTLHQMNKTSPTRRIVHYRRVWRTRLTWMATTGQVTQYRMIRSISRKDYPTGYFFLHY